MKFKKLILFLLVNINFVGVVSAHIGSAGIVQEGKAGNYQVQVYVEPPDVIPGVAKVSVSVDGTDIESVKLSPIYYWTGDEGSPKEDEALPVAGESGRFEGKIWLMESGAASVKIVINGKRGKGETLIPIAAIATAKRDLPKSLGWILAGLALLLVGIMTTIIGASTSDSLLKPGIEGDKKTNRRKVVGSTVGLSFCGLLLFIGNNWWGSISKDYREQYMFRPYTATSTIKIENAQRVLNFKIDSNSLERRWTSYVIPDHGKLMHLFLVRQGTLDAFAHLHPVRKDTITFEAPLPNLPAGKYLVYADILRFHGLQYTIADTVDIPALKISAESFEKQTGDSDDTYVVTNPINNKASVTQDAGISICGTPGVKTALPDGSSIIWEEKPNQTLKAGQVYDLKFSVMSPDGKPAELQTYLGMMGHAAILKEDGSVYIHLHPNGTFSATAQQVMEKRIGEKTNPSPRLDNAKRFRDSVDNVLLQLQALPEAERDRALMGGMVHQTTGHHDGSVSFPYVFPSAGNYRIWLQVKRNGKILTGAFDARVI
ncbi:hypothetical protein [Emticicia sp. C21]|uniref:hypothetical protein n=1 Tax=Emticicia sp. C21 TaxID=2302915 RepID=UPI000E356692|nr:hypothetical protein [Emticicia sp. C21]RFS17141.1 hypothetical protein D0T08_04970 [Emticicia sp. C21]